MRALVTGAAGFIGSHLAQHLLDDGHHVRGADCLTPYYEPVRKRANLEPLLRHERFEFHEVDLRTAWLGPLLDGVDVVYHLAGQPGVRLSWSGFPDYVDHNVLATQRLLEAARTAPLRRFVYASSSSVYGDVDRFPVLETDLPRPHSPYGVTKLAGEHLARLYADNWDVPAVVLRYFSVYGSRQRPDMGIQRLVEAAVDGESFTLFGDGSQQRDFTHVHDVVRATVAAATADVEPGNVYNVAGGASVSMNDLIDVLTGLVGTFPVHRGKDQAGDVRRTGGDTSAARAELGWKPEVPLDEGIREHVAWYRRTSAS